MTERVKEDVVARFEQFIDKQLQAYNDIDKKSEHIMRTAGLIIGIIISGASLALNNSSIDVSSIQASSQIILVAGVGFLFFSLFSAVITYTNVRLKIGLDEKVAYQVAEDDDIDYETHLNRLLTSYGNIFESNKETLNDLNTPLRHSVTSLLVGLLWLSVGVLNLVVAKHQLLTLSVLIIVTIVLYIFYFYKVE